MRCLSTGVDKSEDSDLKGDLPKKNILSGLKDFAEITSGLENKSELKGKFDQFFITILNKLSNVQLGSNYIRKILIEIEKVIELGVIKDEDSLNQTLKTLSQEEKIPSP